MSQLSPGLFLLLLLCFSDLSHARRRGSKAEKAFEESGGIDWKEESEEKEKEPEQGVLSSEVEGTTTTSTSTKTVITQPVSEETPRNDDVISKLLAATKDVLNLTRVAENRLEDEGVTNKTILWIDASYKAMNFNLSVSEYKECAAWRKFWNISTTNEPETSNQTETSEEEENSEEEHEKNRKETDIVKEKERLEELGLSQDLLDKYRAVGIVFKEICGDHGRELWFRPTKYHRNNYNKYKTKFTSKRLCFFYRALSACGCWRCITIKLIYPTITTIYTINLITQIFSIKTSVVLKN